MKKYPVTEMHWVVTRLLINFKNGNGRGLFPE